jgi:DNA-binding LytR/AlgR family response regulator
MPSIVIGDDEPLLRFHLQKALGEVWPDAEILAQAANGEEAFALITELKPDVAFLDIHMPGQSGLDVALKINQTSPKTRVVFLTAYDQYAIKAFEQGAIDYLLKPLDEDRLMQTVQRLEILLTTLQPKASSELEQIVKLVNSQQSAPYLTWLNAQHGDAIKVVSVPDVLMFRAEDKYTTLVTEQGSFLLRLSIKMLEEKLDPSLFWRVHRNTLVNMQHVDRVEKTFSGHLQIFIKNIGKPVPVSRAKQHLFKAD